MNEELIRQCAEEACGPEWYGPRPNLMRGGGELAIRLYHARAVQPLIEAANDVIDCLEGRNFLALDFMRDALAAFEKGEE